MADPDPADMLRLVAAGAAGASVAHELRNALAVAESALFLARRDLDDRARLVRHLDQASAEIQRAHGVIASLLGLTRGEPVRREPALVSRLVEAARRGLSLPDEIVFEVVVEPAELAVECDPILLERVLANLYLNAAEALAPRGPGHITTRAVRADGRVSFTVEDDGPGVSPAILDRVFDPLVTSKRRGTGLGLPLCRTIVEAHGGAISAGAGPGGGASFHFWLPAVAPLF